MFLGGLPVPRQELGQPGLRQVSDAGEDFGKPGLRVDVVHLGGDDLGVHQRRTLAAAVGSGGQPRLASESDAAQRPLGGVVGQADPSVVVEPGKLVGPVSYGCSVKWREERSDSPLVLTISKIKATLCNSHDLPNRVKGRCAAGAAFHRNGGLGCF